jgi:hypothetical protein
MTDYPSLTDVIGWKVCCGIKAGGFKQKGNEFVKESKYFLK